MTLREELGAGRLDFFHIRVVPDPVFDEETRGADRLRDARAGLEGVRVGVRVALDRAHLHVLAADLFDHVRVLVLRAHGDDPAV